MKNKILFVADNQNEFKNCLDGLFESLCDVSDWMYENPELGFEEFKTSKYLVDYIQKNSKLTTKCFVKKKKSHCAIVAQHTRKLFLINYGSS